MNTFDRCANYLENVGWVQNSIGTEKTGRCAMAVLALTDIPEMSYKEAVYRVCKAAGIKVASAACASDGEALIDWNNAPGRTAQEVIAAFRKASKEYEIEVVANSV